MNEDRIVQLLEELRDLQREHMDQYKEAVRNQTEALRVQREWWNAVRRPLRAIPVLIVFSLHWRS